MPSDRELLLEIHRQIEEHLGIGQPVSALGTGRKNSDVIRPVSNPGESDPGGSGISRAREAIERHIQAQGSADGGSAGPTESSKPEG
jgi:hypothetical protein